MTLVKGKGVYLLLRMTETNLRESCVGILSLYDVLNFRNDDSILSVCNAILARTI